jgi:hypothetical protein
MWEPVGNSTRNVACQHCTCFHDHLRLWCGNGVEPLPVIHSDVQETCGAIEQRDMDRVDSRHTVLNLASDGHPYGQLTTAEAFVNPTGVAATLRAGIIAEIGDLARFDYDQAKVAKYAGLQWRRRQSVAFEAEHTPLARTGNHIHAFTDSPLFRRKISANPPGIRSLPRPP